MATGSGKRFVHRFTINDPGVTTRKIFNSATGTVVSTNPCEVEICDLDVLMCLLTFKNAGTSVTVHVYFKDDYEKKTPTESYDLPEISFCRSTYILLAEIKITCKSCGRIPIVVPNMKLTPLTGLPFMLTMESKRPTSNLCQCSQQGYDYAISTEVAFTVQPSVKLPSFLKELHEGLLTDVTLRVCGVDFKAHRCVLAANSPVFKRMFQNENFEENRKGCVEITDFAADVAEVMLSHAYGKNIGDVNPATLVDVLIFAEKYELTELKALCEDLLSNERSFDALHLLAVADSNNAENLKRDVINWIVSPGNRASIIDEASANKLIKSYPKLFVELMMRLANS